MAIRIARIFNTYGPWLLLNDVRLMSNLLLKSIYGKELTIYGNGNQTKSFCFVYDFIDGLTLFIDVGNPEELSIL